MSKQNQKVLLVDTISSFYRIDRYPLGDFFGPIDLGLHLAGKYQCLNIGAGPLAGSIFPGSNRLFFTGYTECWGGFYISSMGGAALVFNNLGINTLSLCRRAPTPSIMYLNRVHGEEIQVDVVPVDVNRIWKQGRGGIYSLMDHVYEQFGEKYVTDPRILAVGPASMYTDFGAIASVPIKKGKLTFVDTWAGRGGFGSKMLQQHGIAAIIYGGTHIEDDFRDRKVADQWFIDKYDQNMAAKDLDATTKYRYDKKFNTGGTFGVNYAKLAGRMLSFNYQSIYMDESERLDIHKNFVLDHYLKQFNEETIAKKQQKHCGEPCSAVCKKMNGEFKKDYEPYQTMGPLSGIFDQRAAEKLNHHADSYGFDGISIGGVVAWLMECLDKKIVKPKELGVKNLPVFKLKDFDLVSASQHNADLGVALMDAIIEKRGLLDLSEGARKLARHLARSHGQKAMDSFLYTAYARKGWMVPNQYWTPGVLSPMPIMGKYYMHYGNDFVPPRELGHRNAERMKKELFLDNLGFCRFHRGWAEDIMPDIIEAVANLKDEFLANVEITASRINSRNSSIFWESERNMDYIHYFLKRERDVEDNKDPELLKWLDAFGKDKKDAALSYWYEVHKGVQESLNEF
jgi:glyceraldehyde-3-phosphate dehydrogenase (ferredoxin)